MEHIQVVDYDRKAIDLVSLHETKWSKTPFKNTLVSVRYLLVYSVSSSDQRLQYKRGLLQSSCFFCMIHLVIIDIAITENYSKVKLQ